MRIEERKFTFIPEKKWKNLTKKEQKILGSYKSYYENYKRTIDEIKELEKEIQIRKDKIKKIETLTLMKIGYVKKMYHLKKHIDQIRDTYNFNWTLSKLTNKDSYNFSISRRHHDVKNGDIGTPLIIHTHLLEFYKSDKTKLEELTKMEPDLKYKNNEKGVKINTQLYNFIKSEVLHNDDSKVRNFIIDSIFADPTLKKSPMSYKLLFPLNILDNGNKKKFDELIKHKKPEKPNPLLLP